jgi:AAA domain (dynein-related subfamily)
VDNGVAGQALAVAVAANVPVLLWGAPGTGKTSVVEALGAASGMAVEVVIGSIREPSDFAGLPVVTDGGVVLSPPSWAVRLAAAGGGLLFLDELTTSPPAVQAAMLRVVLERSVGDLSLPAEVRIVAAANPPEQAADGWDLAAPLANRLVHLDWTVDASTVADGLVLGFPDQSVPQARAASSAGADANARAAVAGFLRVRPMLLLQVPRQSTSAGRGWPSPRSWETVARLIAACEVTGASAEVQAALVVGAVGEGAGIEFLSWLENADLPDPAMVLADPDSFELPERSDRAYAVLSAVTSYAVSRGDIDSWDRCWKVVAKATSAAPEVAALAAKTLARRRPSGALLPATVLELAPVLRAAGLM